MDAPRLPAIVDGVVGHRRHGAVEHAFRHRAHLWLVDLDDLPRLPRWLRPFASFRAADHLGGTGPDATDDLRTNVERFLDLHGAPLAPGGRILMLANARVLGHVFDPLTVFWCLDPDGGIHRVIAEVHNTYGERHAYLLAPDADGDAEVDKAFYVSPFHDVTGRYTLRFTLTPARVGVRIHLVRGGRRVFDASFVGVPRPATTAAIARITLRRPLMPQRVTLLIRLHGLWLWARRLPVIPRPRHRPPQGV